MLGFRVWNLRHNWFENNSHFYVNKEGEFCCHDKGFPMDQYVGMQSTGQLDIDGKWIYEGDVISTYQDIFVYVDCIRNFYIKVMHHKLEGFKVIGNIYENEGLGGLINAGI